METKQFIQFLYSFGVKGLNEYNTFDKEQKDICKREYIKTLTNKLIDTVESKKKVRNESIQQQINIEDQLSDM